MLPQFCLYGGDGKCADSVFIDFVPLRAVLVPTEMLGLTRVDFLLGLALAVTLGSLLAKYGREASPKKRLKKSD